MTSVYCHSERSEAKSRNLLKNYREAISTLKEKHDEKENIYSHLCLLDLQVN